MKITSVILAFTALAGVVTSHAQVCTLAATPVAFGVYDPQTATATDSTGTVTVTCNALIAIGVTYTITVDPGSGGSFAARSMTGPGPPRLLYQLYTDSLRMHIWGDGTGGTTTIADGYALQIALPVIRPYTVYGRIPARQLSAAGPFADSLLVTITY